MHFTIEDLTATDSARIEEAARLLHAAFSPLGVWTTMAEARQEVVESISADRVSRVARTPEGAIIGWIGAIREYDGLVGSCIRSSWTRHGVGTALVERLSWISRPF